MLTTANTGKNRERLRKNTSEWTGRVEISEKEIPGSKRSMYGYVLTTPGYKGRTFKLCVLTGGDFNFCVRSSPQRGTEGQRYAKKTEIETETDTQKNSQRTIPSS